MTKPHPWTIHQHKETGIRMRLISTENDYYFLRAHCWTWFGTSEQFTAQFKPPDPDPSQKEPPQ